MTTSKKIPYGQLDASFQAAGGINGVQKLVEDFYQIMQEHSLSNINHTNAPDATKHIATVRAMHSSDLTESIDKLARFLCAWLGGPRRYREKYGPINIPQVHSHLSIGEQERDAWLNCMQQAIALQNFSEDFANYLMEQLKVPAERIFQMSQKTKGNGTA